MGSCAFARHYLRNRCYFLFLRVLRCFSSPGSLPSWMDDAVARAGLPHSDIRASTGICPYARLFAACHVLLRLREPRHPSCALLSFPFFFRLSNFGSNSVLNISPDCFAILIASQSALKLLFFFFRFTRFLVTELRFACFQDPRGVPNAGGVSVTCFHHVNVLCLFEWRITDSNR